MNKRWSRGLLMVAGLTAAAAVMAAPSRSHPHTITAAPSRSHPPTLGEVRQSADTAYANGDAAAALRGYLDLTRVKAADSVVWTRIGDLYTLQHNDWQALDAYQQAVEMNPSDSEALHNLGMLRIRQGQAMLERESKLLPAGPQTMALQCTIGLLKRAMGDAGQGMPSSCAGAPAVATSATSGAQ